MQPHQQQPKELGTPELLNLVIALLTFFADPVLPYLRKPGTWGERFVSVYTVAGVAAMFFFIGSYGDPIAFPALYLTCGLFLIHRIAGWIRRPEGTHSRFDGVSVFRGKNAKTIKEPLFVALMGIACAPFSEGLSVYLLIASAGLVVGQALYSMRMKAAVRAQRDARIEAGIIRDLYEGQS